MPLDYSFYIEGNFICVIIIAIMLFHDYLNKGRQEKQDKFDHSILAFLLYCISDAIWAMVIDNIIPKNDITIAITNLSNFIILIAITYTWLKYVMAIEQISYRNKIKTRIIILSPFVISTISLIIIYFINKTLLLDEENNPTFLYNALMNVVTYIYIVTVLVYTIRQAIKEKNKRERRIQLEVGFLPLAVVGAGLLQMLVAPNNPIFCFCCSATFLIYYIRSMEDQISLDALTKLNNRGQLLNYISSENGGYKEGKRNYVIMLDINDFKEINDTYGHAEGDNALVLVANALKTALSKQSIQSFLARYGGDEFIIIANLDNETELDSLINNIRLEINNACINNSYSISIGIGYEEIKNKNDDFQQCLIKADEMLYKDKKEMKKEK